MPTEEQRLYRIKLAEADAKRLCGVLAPHLAGQSDEWCVVELRKTVEEALNRSLSMTWHRHEFLEVSANPARCDGGWLVTWAIREDIDYPAPKTDWFKVSVPKPPPAKPGAQSKT